MRDAIVGLAVHSLPLVRSLLQRDYPLEIHEVSVIGSYGYAVLACIGTTTVEFVSAIHGGTAPVWTLEVASADAALHATFPPSYVYAGSVGGSVTTESGVITVAPCAVNGYVEEWRTLWSALTGRSDPDVVPATTLREVLADGAFVIALADAAYDFVVRRDQQATRAQR